MNLRFFSVHHISTFSYAFKNNVSRHLREIRLTYFQRGR